MTPDQMAVVDALIEDAEKRHGTSMYCKVTTYELRKALGQDVSDWPATITDHLKGHGSGAVWAVSAPDTLDLPRAHGGH